MDDLDAELFGQQRPVVAPLGRGSAKPRCLGEIDQRLLDEMRHEPRIGAVSEDRSWAAGIERTKRQRPLAERVIRTCRRRQAWIGVPAGPRLDASVEIKRAFVLA